VHVLVVDDDETVRASLDALACAEIRVTMAAGGQEALDRMAADPVDLVLSDVRMPGLDGLELLRRVRVRAPGADVVLMTAYDDVGVAIVAVREGARALLAKPLDLRDLRALIDRLRRERGEGDSTGDPFPRRPGRIP
jgi:two-component system, NtrC family, nitrogen regulation response regulator GlnG